MIAILPYIIIIFINIIILFLLKEISIKLKIFLILGGGILFFLLQFLYMSFGNGIHINLIIFNIDLQINNFIQLAKEYFDGNMFKIGNIGFFAVMFSFILPAFLEEFGKFFVLKIINKKLQIIQSIVSSVISITYIAIGFAFFESLTYIFFTKESIQELIKISTLRSIISTSSHIFFSIVIGYYYGKAIFLKFEIIDNLEITKTTKILKRFKRIPFFNINSISKYYYIKYMLTGFTISIFFHTLYNAFWEYNLPIYAIITVIIGVAIFLKLIFLKKYNKNYINIKNKIQYLKDIKELKSKISKVNSTI